MPQFRKIPKLIEANQFSVDSNDPDGPSEPRGVCRCAELFDGQEIDRRGRGRPHVHTIHNGQVCWLADGDWVIPEPDGVHFYPVKPDVFATTYEPA